MEESIAKLRRETRAKQFHPDLLIARLKELLGSHNESLREASLRAGLDHQAVRRIMEGQRPAMHICILLADHFEINPNELLQLAGWPLLKMFGVRSVKGLNIPPEAFEVAMAVASITNPGMRKRKADAILALIKTFTFR